MSINNVNLSAHNKNYPLVIKEKTTEDEFNPVEKTLVNSVAPVRRLVGLPDMIKEGDGIAAAGLAALTVVSLPEDCRDLKAAYNHSACTLRRKRLSVPYNYHKYQHDFSFFRGTLLHEGMKQVKSIRGKKLVSKIYNADKTIYNTKFGTWLKKLLGIEEGRAIKTKIKDLYGKEIYIKDVIVKKDFWGLKKLTAHAMKRTTVLGLAFMGALQLPKIIKSFSNGKTKEDKIKAFVTQTAKSTMNVLGMTVGMGYLGALGAKKYGALGSLIGMGLGVIAGASASQGIQKIFIKN